MKFGATLRAAAESARLHAHADRFVPYDELKAALRQPALAGPAEFLGELKLQMEELNAHVGGCVEALEAIVAGAGDFATLAKCVTESGALLAFAQLNATALRKLGTKYDKRRRERLAHMGGIDSISAQAAVDRLLEGAPFCTAHTDALRALEAEVERRACPHPGASPCCTGKRELLAELHDAAANVVCPPVPAAPAGLVCPQLGVVVCSQVSVVNRQLQKSSTTRRARERRMNRPQSPLLAPHQPAVGSPLKKLAWSDRRLRRSPNAVSEPALDLTTIKDAVPVPTTVIHRAMFL